MFNQTLFLSFSSDWNKLFMVKLYFILRPLLQEKKKDKGHRLVLAKSYWTCHSFCHLTYCQTHSLKVKEIVTLMKST